MTKRCTLKEAFIEKLLDDYQPDWRQGMDITAETKQKIKEYATSKLPEGLKEEVECITEYSIAHMARKIRHRENLSQPKKSNQGNRSNRSGMDSICNPRKDDEPAACDTVMDAVSKLLERFGLCAVMAAIELFKNKTPANPEREDEGIPQPGTSSGMKFPINLDTESKNISAPG